MYEGKEISDGRQQRTEPALRTPNAEAVKRIAAHLWGEDIVNLRAAVESFANGWTVVPKAEAAEQSAPLDALIAAIHGAMCEVSHHDSQTVCKNQRRYELIGQSVLARLGSDSNE